MRLLCALPIVVFLISITGCQTGPSETDRQMAKNLKEINQNLTALNKLIKEAREEAKNAKNQPAQSVHGWRGPDFRRLRKIKLAKNPSREQVENYIDKIIKASQGQNSFSPTDPQVNMLCSVGSENVDILLGYAKDVYVLYALPYIVTEKNKKQILEALKVYPQLISCVVKNDWIKDAKEIIFERLNSKTTAYLPPLWITVAAQLASPKEYGILENAFIYGNNPELSYRALSRVDSFDMKKTVAKAWKAKNASRNPWAKKQMAIIAARLGHKDALEYLIRAYRTETNQYIAGQLIAAIYQLTGKTFSPGKVLKWYKENEENLVFDPENEEYIIKAKAKKK